MERTEEDQPDISYYRADYNGVKAMGNAPEYNRQAYLEMLERIVRSLGSTCSAKFELSTPRSITRIPPFPASVAARYEILGKQLRYSLTLEDMNETYSWQATTVCSKRGFTI